MSDEEYHELFHEIIEGKSRFWFEGSPYFFIHPTPQIKSKALLLFKDWKRFSENRGTLSEAQSMERLVSKGLWSKEDDEAIEEVKQDIKLMASAERNLILPTQKVKQKRLMRGREKDLSELLKRKKELVGKTSEDYAHTRSAQELIRISIVNGSGELVWPIKDDFDDLEIKEFEAISKNYYEMYSRLSDEVIQNLVLQDFFYIYMPHCEKPAEFFGKALVELSSYQIKTTTYGNVFYQIMQQNDDITDEARKDPEQLFSISSNAKKEREGKKGKQNENGAKVYFGAKSEDMESFVKGGDREISINDKIAEINKKNKSSGPTISGPDVAALFGQ